MHARRAFSPKSFGNKLCFRKRACIRDAGHESASVPSVKLLHDEYIYIYTCIYKSNEILEGSILLVTGVRAR